MMNARQFQDYCKRLNIPASGQAYLQRVRSSPPSRRVSSRVGNCVCRYPSRKMGFVVSTESRHGELATVYQLEHDSAVLEFFDQPEAIKLVYYSRSGRLTGAMHTPDFLLLRRDSVCWIEIKPEERLLHLAEIQPHRWQRNDLGRWRCPPADEAAKEYGFSYQILSIAEINRTLIGNLEFLDDYYRDPKPHISPELKDQLVTLIREHPGISIASVRGKLGAESVDALFALIATGEIFFNLERQAISEQETAHLFESQSVAEALGIVGATPCPGDEAISRVNGHDLKGGPEPGTFLLQPALLASTRVAELPVRPGGVDGTAAASPDVLALLQGATSDDLANANLRYALLHDAKLAKGSGLSKRTFRRLRHSCRRAEELYGLGYVGLLRRYSWRGNRTPRLPTRIYEIADQVIREVYLTPKRVTKMFAYGRFANRCQEACLQPPSYPWFVKAIGKRKAYEVKLAREGKRAAYPLEFPTKPLSARNENHGAYPWQVVHIDHTEVDVELVDEATGILLGRPWLTLMSDAYSRRVFCFALSFDPPSVTSLKLLLRECVRLHSRLPSCLVLDWGKEFGSEFFETLTAIYEIRIVKRPPHQARYGSVIEREFGTLNKQFFHNLQGNTQNVRDRLLTKSLDPKRLAVWSLETLHKLLRQFCFEIYDHRLHSGIGMTPAKAYERGIAVAGARPSRRVEYDDVFKFLTMVTTPKGTARIRPGMGVKVRYLYYWAEAMRDPQWEGKEVPVRYDQEDLGVAYACLGGRWVQCISCHYNSVKGRSEKQLRLVLTELRQKRSVIEGSRTITARQIARFFESVEAEEVLREQRLKDEARKRILADCAAGPGAAAAVSAERGRETVVQTAEEPAAPADTDSSPAPGPVFEGF